MRLTLPAALVLAVFANLLPGCSRVATDQEEASQGATKDPAKKADARSAPAQSSGSY